MIGCEFCRRTGKELSSKLCNKMILPGYRDHDTPADYFLYKIHPARNDSTFLCYCFASSPSMNCVAALAERPPRPRA